MDSADAEEPDRRKISQTIWYIYHRLIKLDLSILMIHTSAFGPGQMEFTSLPDGLF